MRNILKWIAENILKWIVVLAVMIIAILPTLPEAIVGLKEIISDIEFLAGGSGAEIDLIIGGVALAIAVVTIFIAIVAQRTAASSFSAASSLERLETDSTDRLIELRRRIEREKDIEAASILREEARRYEEQLIALKRSALWTSEGDLTKSWSEVIAVSRERLIEETDRLSARSRANLRIGMLLSLLGVIFILYSLFYLPDIDETSKITTQVLTYLPRLTLLIVVQLIGGFFLRMYVSNENDIKQNKNEITNLELKLAGTLLISEDRKAKSAIAELLVKNERNFILKKGEKVSGEAWRTEAEDLRGIVVQLVEKLKPSGASK